MIAEKHTLFFPRLSQRNKRHLACFCSSLMLVPQEPHMRMPSCKLTLCLNCFARHGLNSNVSVQGAPAVNLRPRLAEQQQAKLPCMTFTCQHCGVWCMLTSTAGRPFSHDPASPTQKLRGGQASGKQCIAQLCSAFVQAVHRLNVAHRRRCIAQLCVAFVHALYCLKVAHCRRCIAQLCVAFVLAAYCLKIAHCRLLQALLKHCPGMAQAHLVLAESHYLGGNSPVALRKVADVLHQAPDNISAHMLLTRIYLHQVRALGIACGDCMEEPVTDLFGHDDMQSA